MSHSHFNSQRNGVALSSSKVKVSSPFKRRRKAQERQVSLINLSREGQLQPSSNFGSESLVYVILNDYLQRITPGILERLRRV